MSFLRKILHCTPIGINNMNIYDDKLEKEKHDCPICKSDDTIDISPGKSNGILGPGHHFSKLVNLWKCNKCTIVFSPNEEI